MSAQPIIMVLDADLAAPDLLLSELHERYGGDYDVIVQHTAQDVQRTLEGLAKEGRRVAVLLAERSEHVDARFLTRAAELHPDVRRGLLVPVADRPAADAVLRDAVLGLVDFWAQRPWRAPDEDFHAQITEVLREWQRDVLPRRALVHIVGERWDARAHEVRDLLDRNRIPHQFHEVGSDEGRGLLVRAHAGPERLPVLGLFDGNVLVDPSNADVAESLGVKTRPAPGTFDVVVIGGGPAGLAASVYGTSEGLRTALLEREAMGGQAGTTSMIKNYLGFPRGVSGAELMQRAYEQAWLFGTEFVYTNEATRLRVDGEGHVVTLADGCEIETRSVILASGVSYRRLDIPRLEALRGAGVFYGAAVAEASAMSDEHVFVLGGGNSAGQAAVHLSRFARRVTVLVRGPSLAESMSEYLIRELSSKPNVDVRFETVPIGAEGESRLESMVLQDLRSGSVETTPAAALFVLIGAEPHTGWLPEEVAKDKWGYVVTGRDLIDAADTSWTLGRAPMPLETSAPGVFAAGDIRHGSVKRIASAVGEGSVAIRLVHDYLSGS